MNDRIVEGTESFKLEIMIDKTSTENAAPGDRKSATGHIIDSTG